MWSECGHCGALYERDAWREEQRFCCRSCARLHRYHGPVVADPLQPIADRCAKFIRACGTKDGVSPRDLARYVDAYRALASDDRFRVNVLVCKAQGVAYTADDEDFRFWPRAVAPEGTRAA